MKVQILGGPYDGQEYEIDGEDRTSVNVAVPSTMKITSDYEGEALEPPHERYTLPIRNGRAYWNERELIE